MNYFTQSVVNDSLQSLAQSLPCSVVAVEGSIVTVNFEVISDFTLPQVTIPVIGFEYIRYPIQVGDKGFTLASNASLKQMSGLGTGVADLINQGNLTMLAFCPLGNKNWFPVNPNYLVLYGKEGVEIRNKSGSVTIVLTDSGVTINGKVTINGDVETTGTLKNNGVNVGSDHVHGGVNRGGVNTFVPQ
jgi:hypothetical protein